MAESLTESSRGVVGRFAPSPTGPLHFGTLVAALGSYLAARCRAGRWTMRIEDIDGPRVVEGAADAMLRLLERLGFEWDGPVVYQSQRFDRYHSAIEALDALGHLFRCSCSRREILASAPHPGEDGPIYPGTCRQAPRGSRKERSVRLRVADQLIRFEDQVFGAQSQNLERQVGDFVLHRADGVFAYQLAVVVDDIDMGVTQVVRGADLLSSTARQIFLYACFNATAPTYAHLPLVLSENGEKISKRDGPTILVSEVNGAQMIWSALEFLGQTPPADLQTASTEDLLRWGVENFRMAAISQQNRLPGFSF